MKKKILLFSLLIFASVFTHAQTLYWIGGSGNWSDINHWSLTSGNSGGILAPSIPQALNNVVFDANSGFLAGNNTVTVNQNSICSDITVSGVAASPIFNGAYILEVRGSANYQTGTVINHKIYFTSANPGNTIAFNGGATGSVSMYFNGAGGWLLSGNLTSTGHTFFARGTLDFGASNITTNSFTEGRDPFGNTFASVEPRSLNLGSSVINLTGSNGYISSTPSWIYTGTNLNAGTSKINLTRAATSNLLKQPFYGKNGHTYYDVAFTNVTPSPNDYSRHEIISASSSDNVNFNTLSFAADGNINNNGVINRLEVAKSGKYLIYGRTINSIIDNTLDCETKWELSIPQYSGYVLTSPNPITLNNVVLKNVVKAGVGPFTVNNGLDLGGNTGWIFNNIGKNLYWIGGGGNWTDPLHWTTNTDGTPIPGGCLPTRYDNVFFNNFSGAISTASPVIVNSSTAECKNITWVGVAGTPVFKTGTTQQSGQYTDALNIYGSSIWQNGMLYQVANTFYKSAVAGNTLTSNGVKIEGDTYFVADGGWTLNDAFLSGAMTGPGISYPKRGDLYFNRGTFNTNNQALTITSFGHYNDIYNTYPRSTRNLTLGSSLITINGKWDYSNEISTPVSNLNAGTSHIVVVNNNSIPAFRFTPGQTYHDVSFTATTGRSIFGCSYVYYVPSYFNTITFASDAYITPYNDYIYAFNVNTLNLAPSKIYDFDSRLTLNVNNLNANTPSCVPLLEIKSSVYSPYVLQTVPKLKLANPTTITNAKVTGIDASSGLPLTIAGGIDGGNNVNVNIAPTAPRNFYWIGGTGNWSDQTHWTLNADGTANPIGGCMPLATDNVFFNQYSGTNYTVNLDVTANCNNMTWEEVAGSAPILKGFAANPLNIGGSLVLQTGMDYDVERTNFIGTTANTITTHGVNMDYASANIGTQGVYFYGTGSWTLNDTFNVKNFGLKNGTLNTNNQLINAENYYSDYTTGTITRTLNLGSSVINIAGYWDGSGINVLNAGTSVININATMASTNGTGGGIYTGMFSASNVVYNDVNFTNPSVTGTIQYAATTFNNVTFAGNAKISGNNTFNVITFAPNKRATIVEGTTQTVNNIINNTSCGVWELTTTAFPYSSVAAGARAIIKSTNNITFNNAYITNINATGGGAFNAVGVDNGNNTGITFSNPIGKNYYWIGGSGDWNDAAHWTTNANGTPSGNTCIPTRFDDVFFNSYSGTSPVITPAGIVEYHNMTWSGVPGTPTILYAGGSAYGSVTLQSNLSGSFSLNFMSTELGKTITTNGAVFGDIFFKGSGEYILQDNLTAGKISFTNGTLNTNGKTVSASSFSSETSTSQSLILGSSSIYITGWDGDNWKYLSNSLDAGTSRIYIKGAATKFTAKDDAVYNAVIFDTNGNQTNYLYGAITTNELTFPATNSTNKIEAGKTITVNNLLQMSGTNCATTKIQSTIAGTQAAICVKAGNRLYNFVSIKDINASCLSFSFLPQSTNEGNNTNMTFQPNNGSGIGLLGADRTVCANELPIVLDASAFTPNANSIIQWRNVTTSTDLGQSITQAITASGTYRVSVNYGAGCIVTDEVVVTVNPGPALNAVTLNACAITLGGNTGNFTLTDANAMLVTTPTNYTFTYHATSADAIAGANSLANTYTGVNNTVYVRVIEIATGCISTRDVALVVLSKVSPVAAANQKFCITDNGTLANISITGTNIQWYADAVSTTVLPTTTLLVNGTTYYATQTVTDGCENERIPVAVTVESCFSSRANPSLRMRVSQ